MITIAAPCPRCGQPKSMLQTVWADGPFNQRVNVIPRELLVQCVHCQQHSIALVRAQANLALFGGQCRLTGDIVQLKELTLVRLVPAPAANRAPDSVPEAVATAFVDGLDILATKKWTPAAGSFRTALDRATKLVWPKDQPDMPFKLDRRLKGMQQALGLPQPMLDWADGIRVVGNELHELDDINEADALDTAHFTETLLTYMFTLPERVRLFQERRAPQPAVPGQ
jgi:hypothetical protein